MIDIVAIGNGPGSDLRTYDAQTPKGANVLSVQLGALEYAPTFGVDLAYFLQENFQFQTASFKAYCIQRLTESGVNVADVLDTMLPLVEKFTFVVGDQKNTSNGGLIA